MLKTSASSPDGRPRPRVVIVGGGFGGLYAAQSLKRVPVDVTLIDRRNFHLFQPLLYQVATGGLSPGDIASPLRSILKRQKNVRVVLDTLVDLEPEHKKVILTRGELVYDYLILALGLTHHYFGHEEWIRHAPGIKTVEDATRLRSKILLAFELAETEPDADRRRALITFVIVGGGPTGVEMAGALAELARETLKHDFRTFDPANARIILVEASDRILPGFPPLLSEKAATFLRELGVEVWLQTLVTHIEPDQVVLKRESKTLTVKTSNVIWAAGVRAPDMAALIAQKTGARQDRMGRIYVGEDCSLESHPEIFIVGDLAHFEQHGEVLPAVAPVAMQQGRYVARCIQRRLTGKPDKPFVYLDKGSLAVIGRSRAVARIGRIRSSGFFAWILWLFVHLLYMVEFENRVLVLIQWAWNYFTRNRGARLITAWWPEKKEEKLEIWP